MSLLKFKQYFLYLLFVIVLSLCSRGLSISDEHILDLDPCNRNQTCQSSMNGTKVAEMCNGTGLKIHDRCCVNTTNTTVIIGINLRNCGIRNLSGVFHHLEFLRVIMLEENPLPHNLSSDDFENILHIDYLSLSSNYECPGGHRSWENITKKDNTTECLDEVDICKSYNVSCPTNSYCVNIAPGSTECLCLTGYHGYKCLRKGTFPVLKFSIGIVAATVVICVFLWVTQRRHVKKQV